jgi:hypothetical protein
MASAATALCQLNGKLRIAAEQSQDTPAGSGIAATPAPPNRPGPAQRACSHVQITSTWRMGGEPSRTREGRYTPVRGRVFDTLDAREAVLHCGAERDEIGDWTGEGADGACSILDIRGAAAEIEPGVHSSARERGSGADLRSSTAYCSRAHSRARVGVLRAFDPRRFAVWRHPNPNPTAAATAAETPACRGSVWNSRRDLAGMQRVVHPAPFRLD